ncbi:dTDP-4-dehydrorhamnose 3,5-epimerase [Lacinutrix iliipiscaria]|uniref:dTDP-4-dehydrorhamnose 3,5-epimerase n=1 Tax=Lacinutrix iliipiscaria TaxID=1230532 RepID=A0ABW5WKV0_9FLAO
MTVEEIYLKGSYIISPKVFKDSRGYFFESFNMKNFQDATGLKTTFVQDNQSQSSKGVLRGLHYQSGEFAQAKLVQVIKGSVLDVIVDLRRDSLTFGKHFSIVLDGKTKQQLYVPKDFAHGFLVLEDDTIFSYKCDAYYNAPSEKGIIYNDKTLNINWNIPIEQLILSDKDLKLPTFENEFK